MRTNYVFIDYENVQPEKLNALDKEHFKVFVFVGALQSTVSADMFVSALQLGNVTGVKVSGKGKNALDFHIACYIGQITATDPSAYIHIISNDTGFDPLVTHLKAKGFSVRRLKDVKGITPVPTIKATQCHTMQEKLGVVVTYLKNSTKPRVVKTLSSHIRSIFKKALSDEEVAGIIKELEKQKIITLTDAKVSYSLPETST